MIKKTGRRPVKAVKVKTSDIKKESPSSKKMLIVGFVLIVLIIAVSFRSKEKVPPPQETVVDSGQVKSDVDAPAKDTVQQPQSATPSAASIGPASIRQIRITPETPKIGDSVKVSYEGAVAGEEKLPVEYEWRRNGEKLEETSNTLLITSDFKRGDKIDVTLSLEGEKGKKNSWYGKLSIANSPPEIVSATDLTKIDGNKFTFQVKAKDADGDPLKYSLKSSTEDATIDSSTGKVIFTVPEGKKGKFPVVVSVTDGNGGEATYTFEMTLDVGKPQAK